ncbi:nitrous oxide reductase accessory protein NosL [Halorussus caseinilyticus]|uniref:Nitrous oxide reductase accessory protein NosL n=1 Tax=Halorussus caseinilyticus TaxID=3034025 RepID=A0ABD5WMG2_9EURY
MSVAYDSGSTLPAEVPDEMNPKHVLAVLFAFLLVSSAAFAVDVGARRPEPVPFEDTIDMGMTAATTVEARERGVEIPRAEVFYSQYRYVVGYHGVTSLVDELAREGHARQFGVPLTVYVSDYADARLEVGDDGYLRKPDTPSAYVGWVAAEDAYFVVGSRARTPAGEAVVPFSTRSAAAEFAAEYGGELRRWEAVRATDFGTGAATRESFRTAVRERHQWADQRVADADRLLDRPVSVVVGEDAPTLAAAVDAAPPNTAVRVPPGTYDADRTTDDPLTIDKPLTLRGAGNATHLRGDGTGTVVTATAPRVAVADLRISGVGGTLSAENVSTDRADQWDYRVQLGYGYGDAGVTLDSANGSLVRNVSVDTPANGVVVRWSQNAVVENVTVVGSEEWTDGFMGVMVMRSRVVVQDSTFVGGRDGVYTHLADGLVVRDNRMVGRDGMRFGVHEMYTSGALVANNTATGTDMGVVVMTRPTGNLIVGNEVRDSYSGVNVGGRASYVAENVVVDNHYGLEAPSRTSSTSATSWSATTWDSARRRSSRPTGSWRTTSWTTTGTSRRRSVRSGSGPATAGATTGPTRPARTPTTTACWNDPSTRAVRSIAGWTTWTERRRWPSRPRWRRSGRFRVSSPACDPRASWTRHRCRASSTRPPL